MPGPDDRTRNTLLIETLDHLIRSLPPEISEGLRAMTMQTYTEANVKNGVQYSATTYFTGLTAGETIDLIIQTADNPVAIKAQYIAAKNSGDILVDWYRDPVFTGGTDISAGVFNQNDINPVASAATLIGPLPTNAAGGDYSPNDATKPTVSALGTKIQPTLVVLGNSGAGASSSAARNVTIGLEQILAPNTTYLYRRTCVAAVASLFGFSTWYEGGLDLPRP